LMIARIPPPPQFPHFPSIHSIPFPSFGPTDLGDAAHLASSASFLLVIRSIHPSIFNSLNSH
jgi:hypothetical protein